ncbi:hypothetical protein N656DRAFT_778532 [Canariomyces notabilis]|uniref:Uncharacterized protein n=1 Tax=Canariomyces notabilis TaxID=2074819 RepID=A0AAN6YT25_9PEZI|nr:hypothetical protein N656DRAFT_778532 [Canariomyces arenarius]
MYLLPLIAAAFLSSASSGPLTARLAEVGTPCGAELGDCPTLTCIPLSSNCTYFPKCRGTCQDLSVEKQQIYTVCGGWSYYDDCDERVESCMTDPRHYYSCGPSCDGMGICYPIKDGSCGGNTGRECGPGKVCFGGDNMKPGVGYLCDLNIETGEKICGGVCLPLRFGSDGYEKSKEAEVVRTDQDGWQGENP